MFLDTDRSVACLYHCPTFLSPLSVLDKCYDRNPFSFERTTKFVEPIIAQTFDFACEIPCLGDYTNMFQLDPENDNSWYQLSRDPMLLKKLCCSSQLILDILLSFFLSTLDVLECTLPSN